MKQCLITGGGSKFGQHLTHQLLAAGYHVHLITSNINCEAQDNLTILPVDWKSLSMQNLRSLVPNANSLDLIFFNHNASALNKDRFVPGQLQSYKDWQHSYFVACQMPFYLVHVLANKIMPSTKICWMLSELIFDPVDSQVGFADYIGNKFTNACIMKSFSINHPGCFFGMHPDGGVGSNDDQKDIVKAKHLVEFMDTTPVDQLNGNIFSTQGQLCNFVSSLDQ